MATTLTIAHLMMPSSGFDLAAKHDRSEPYSLHSGLQGLPGTSVLPIALTYKWEASALHWRATTALQEACEQGRLGLGLGDAAPSLAPVIKAAADLASAMAHLHGRDIVHGNLCAASVLLAASPVEGHNFAVKVHMQALSMLPGVLSQRMAPTALLCRDLPGVR